MLKPVVSPAGLPRCMPPNRRRLHLYWAASFVAASGCGFLEVQEAPVAGVTQTGGQAAPSDATDDVATGLRRRAREDPEPSGRWLKFCRFIHTDAHPDFAAEPMRPSNHGVLRTAHNTWTKLGDIDSSVVCEETHCSKPDGKLVAAWFKEDSDGGYAQVEAGAPNSACPEDLPGCYHLVVADIRIASRRLPDIVHGRLQDNPPLESCLRYPAVSTFEEAAALRNVSVDPTNGLETTWASIRAKDGEATIKVKDVRPAWLCENNAKTCDQTTVRPEGACPPSRVKMDEKHYVVRTYLTFLWVESHAPVYFTALIESSEIDASCKGSSGDRDLRAKHAVFEILPGDRDVTQLDAKRARARREIPDGPPAHAVIQPFKSIPLSEDCANSPEEHKKSESAITYSRCSARMEFKNVLQGDPG